MTPHGFGMALRAVRARAPLKCRQRIIIIRKPSLWPGTLRKAQVASSSSSTGRPTAVPLCLQAARIVVKVASCSPMVISRSCFEHAGFGANMRDRIPSAPRTLDFGQQLTSPRERERERERDSESEASVA